MELDEAIGEFQGLMKKLKPSWMPSFVAWIQDHVETVERDCLENIEDDDRENTDVILESIRDDLRQSVPLNGFFATENIIFPTVGLNADCSPDTTAHADAFLYDGDTLNEMCNKGTVSMHYCKSCGSRNVCPLTIITHSASEAQIKCIFQYLLPDLAGKTVLDVGSRLGTVLYGAYLLTNASDIVGVEIDESLYKTQKKIVEKYKMCDRIQIIHSDILNKADILQKADVVVLNNVFEFFMPLEEQAKAWQFIYTNVQRRGVFLVTVPKIEASLKNLKTNIKVSDWVQPVDMELKLEKASLRLLGKRITAETDLADLHLYEVL